MTEIVEEDSFERRRSQSLLSAAPTLPSKSELRVSSSWPPIVSEFSKGSPMHHLAKERNPKNWRNLSYTLFLSKDHLINPSIEDVHGCPYQHFSGLNLWSPSLVEEYKDTNCINCWSLSQTRFHILRCGELDSCAFRHDASSSTADEVMDIEKQTLSGL